MTLSLNVTIYKKRLLINCYSIYSCNLIFVLEKTSKEYLDSNQGEIVETDHLIR